MHLLRGIEGSTCFQSKMTQLAHICSGSLIWRPQSAIAGPNHLFFKNTKNITLLSSFEEIMSCTLGRSGLGQHRVALCSISRCRVTKQELKASRKHIRNLFNTVKVKKKIRWISELDLILQFFWHKTTFFSFSNSNWRETPDEYLLGKVVFCFSIQCTFPQIRTTPIGRLSKTTWPLDGPKQS